MKHDQNHNNLGKKLTRGEMKKLQGGLITSGLWVCPSNGYECYFYKGDCQLDCPRPNSCRWYAQCP